MGYDMSWAQGMPDEMLDAARDASAEFQRAADARDRRSREIVSEMIGRDITFPEDQELYWDYTRNRFSPEHQKEIDDLQAVVSVAYDKQYDTDESYFRANIWGMSILRDFMWAADMMIDDPINVVAKITSSGFADEEDEWHYASSFDDEGEEVEDEAASLEYDRRVEVIESLTTEEVRGISPWKFSSNDGWWVTPVEINAAIEHFSDISYHPDPILNMCEIAYVAIENDRERTKGFSNVKPMPSASEPGVIIRAAMDLITQQLNSGKLLPSADISPNESLENIQVPETATEVEAIAIEMVNNIRFFLRFVRYMSLAAKYGGGFHVY